MPIDESESTDNPFFAPASKSQPPASSASHPQNAAALAWFAQTTPQARRPVDPQRLPTQIGALLTPPLARPQSLGDEILEQMASVPSAVQAAGETVGSAVTVVADGVVEGVKSALPFDVEMFRDIAALLVGVLSRNAHEVPPLDMGELLLCIGMYMHYQLQKKLDDGGPHSSPADIFEDTPRVRDRATYERFVYCISFAEAAYEYDVEAVLAKCTKLQSTESIFDAVFESTHDCPAFFMALDKENWKIVIAIRGTASLHDAVVDLKMDCEPFLGGYAHQGMAHLCHKLVERILPKLTALQRIHPNFEILITGHSLGAGIASLLTLLLTSDEYKTQFPHVRGVCFATPACCTEDLVDRAEHCVDSLILGYDVVPALSEKSLIWLLRELQKFSKTNQHRKLLSEAWTKQLDGVYDALETNPRTKFVIDAWESGVATTVRSSVTTAASVATNSLVTVTTTVQETAIQIAEAAGDAVVTLQESGFIPAEPSFFQRNRYRLATWFAGLRDDIRQTSTLITLGLALSSRLIIRRTSKRFLLISLSAAVLGQVGWMRWKRSTAEKLETDLAEKETARQAIADADYAESSGGDQVAERSPSMRKDSISATGISSGSQGDGTAESSHGEMKDLLTPATLYYLHDWIPPSATAESSSDPDIRAGDVAAAVAAAERQELTDDDYDDDLAVVVAADAPVPREPEVIKKHVLVRSLPTNFTEIAMNVRMIDDHLLSSYRRALDNTLWEDNELLGDAQPTSP